MGNVDQGALFPELVQKESTSFDPETFVPLNEAPPEIIDTSECEPGVLFDKGESWEHHWKGMPEYISEDLTPFKTIYLHFENREGMEAFAKLVGQTVTLDTKSLWYPEAEIGRIANKRYIQKAPMLYPDRQRPDEP